MAYKMDIFSYWCKILRRKEDSEEGLRKANLHPLFAQFHSWEKPRYFRREKPRIVEYNTGLVVGS